MPEFKVHSPFQPTGDQPQAIEALVASLNAGNRYTTLLGATGTGKSLGYDEPVFIVEETGNECRSVVTPIGPFIDSLLETETAKVKHDRDTAVLEIARLDKRYLVQAFDPQTCTTDLYPISSFIRHTAPAEMYYLQTRCGRSAILTADHNLWVLRDGQLRLIRTVDARPGDYVPLPDVLLVEGHRRTLDALAVLSGKRLFVQANQSVKSFVEQHGEKKFFAALEAHGISGYNKLWAIEHHKRGQGIALNVFANILDVTNGLGGLWNPATARVGGKRASNSLPAEIPLTPEFMELLGYYVAEGHSRPRIVLLANRNQTIRSRIQRALAQLGIPCNVNQPGDIRIPSAALAELLGRLCGTHAQNKRLPEFWPQLDQALLGRLLSAYFDGDGTVGRASDVSATTASARLASDLAYALLSLGIWARISRRWKRASGTQHGGDWYYKVTISGQADLQRFAERVGFSVMHKQERLTQQLTRCEHSNVDLVPINGNDLRRLRVAVGLTARALGERSGLSRSAVRLFERGKRKPRRARLMRMLAVLHDAAVSVNVDEVWWNEWRKLSNLCQLRWTEIHTVERVRYEQPFVYDLAVPGVENFLAGHGGFFLHNTYTIAKVIERVQRPTLVIAHNKTLAAQLYAEFKEFFPENAVEYFVSYYDYYQPEAYVPRYDLYIEKDASINDEIDRLRLAATSSLMSRRDVIIVASVSCIYGVGNPEDYGRFVVKLARGEVRRRDVVLRMLVAIQYERNDANLTRGRFRVRGDTLEVQPAYAGTAYRIEFFGDEVERITEIDTLTGEILKDLPEVEIYPAKHYITPQEKLQRAIREIEQELEERIAFFKSQEKYLEAQRIEQRTRYDIEMLREVGFTSGIENYSRLLDGRPPGTPPFTLLDYFPDDFLLVIDESHMTIPQIRGMYNGDRERKQVLVDYGFRLPSALDNRPLKFEEFEQRFRQVIFTSATPGPYELQHSAVIVDQVIRPTGIVDPVVEVRPVRGQVDDLIGEIRERVARGERTLVTTLTKRMAEDLTGYLQELGIKVQYLHSEVQTVERVEILRDLRLGEYDVVVGINLLREGLDLPEVSLVAILDADKEGFLRSATSLIQTIGRAARHVNGKVIMYADTVTDSMRMAIEETERRRAKQIAYNEAHGIQPQSIYKAIRDLTDRVRMAEGKAGYEAKRKAQQSAEPLALRLASLPKSEQKRLIAELEEQMRQAAKDLEFEKAAMLRDQILELRQLLNDVDDQTPEWEKIRRMRDYGVDGDEERQIAGEVAQASTRYAIKKSKKAGPRKRR